jgi:hypothetical protein
VTPKAVPAVPAAKPSPDAKQQPPTTTAPADVDASAAKPEFELDSTDAAKATVTLPPTGLPVATPTTRPATAVKEVEYK